MQVLLRINGMMCPHCEGRVKQTLEGLAEIKKAHVSHKEGTAVVVLDKQVSPDLLKSLVEAQGYSVTAVETIE